MPLGLPAKVRKSLTSCISRGQGGRKGRETEAVRIGARGRVMAQKTHCIPCLSARGILLLYTQCILYPLLLPVPVPFPIPPPPSAPLACSCTPILTYRRSQSPLALIAPASSPWSPAPRPVLRAWRPSWGPRPRPLPDGGHRFSQSHYALFVIHLPFPPPPVVPLPRLPSPPCGSCSIPPP